MEKKENKRKRKEKKLITSTSVHSIIKGSGVARNNLFVGSNLGSSCSFNFSSRLRNRGRIAFARCCLSAARKFARLVSLVKKARGMPKAFAISSRVAAASKRELGSPSLGDRG